MFLLLLRKLHSDKYVLYDRLRKLHSDKYVLYDRITYELFFIVVFQYTETTKIRTLHWVCAAFIPVLDWKGNLNASFREFEK